jgi:hypothetical protein
MGGTGMLARSRRDILATTIVAIAFMVSQPSRGRSQGFALPGLEIILNALASGLSLIDSLGKLLWGSPSICKISKQDLGVLAVRCRTLAISLESLNYEPVIENGNEGAIPALTAYQQETKNIQHWKRAQEALTQLLLNAQALLASVAHITGPNMEWSSVNVQLPVHDIETITQALNMFEPTLVKFNETANRTSRIPPGDVQHIHDLLVPLPTLAANALGSILSWQEARQNANCT